MYYINTDNLVGDKIFAAFLNNESEIIVAGSLYKITSKGVFFGKLEDSLKIRKQAFKNNNEKYRLSIPVCEVRKSQGGVMPLDDPEVFRYIAPYNQAECRAQSSNTGSTSSSSNNF